MADFPDVRGARRRAIFAIGLTTCARLVMGCARFVGAPSGGADGAGGATPVAQDAAPAVDLPPSSGDAPPPSDGAGATTGPCVGLQCQQVACAGGATTTVSGTAFAPNGKLPLYNVMVYVPNAPLPAFTVGVTCDRCGGGVPVKTVASAISDAEGKFRITDVPVGKDIPLVLQVGKWRRKVTLANVTGCQDNPITDPNLSRLPRNRQEGDMPRIAVTTGNCDDLGCLLPKVGIDPAELGVVGEDRAVTYYKGAAFPSYDPGKTPRNATVATDLWRSEPELSKYDMALLSCDCSENQVSKGPMAYTAITDYLAKGGRVFGSHYMYVWYQNTTDPRLAAAMTIEARRGDGDNPLTIDTSFPKGKALADWMKFLAPASSYGALPVTDVFDNITAAMTPTAQVWASSIGTESGMVHPRIVTINTPAGVPAAQQCGRAVDLDVHVADRSIGGPTGPFPKSCDPVLVEGEQALAFLFFDLASCIQDESHPVPPPLIIP